VSSAGLRKPVGEAYPAPDLLARFAAAGVPFTTASDAHRLDRVAERRDEGRSLLAAVGCTSLQAYRDRQPRTVPLEAAPKGAASRQHSVLSGQRSWPDDQLARTRSAQQRDPSG
jgi:histidinol-phosphatase (PHP family)